MTKRKPPKARLVRPEGRPIQAVYKCPLEEKNIRISTGTYDEREAEDFLADIQAKLRVGVSPRSKRSKSGETMPWETFREQYTRVHLKPPKVREKAAIDAESRLNVAERIVKPRTLTDMANAETLYDLQTRLLAGEEGRFKNRKRSRATVRGYMRAVIAALNWAYKQGWLKRPIEMDVIDVDDEFMKGRPLEADELERLLTAVPGVVGEAAAYSWIELIHGVVNSGLRLGELMNISWVSVQCNRC